MSGHTCKALIQTEHAKVVPMESFLRHARKQCYFISLILIFLCEMNKVHVLHYIHHVRGVRGVISKRERI